MSVEYEWETKFYYYMWRVVYIMYVWNAVNKLGTNNAMYYNKIIIVFRQTEIP